MKEDRIELRTSQKERKRLLEAAAFKGMSLSAFSSHPVFLCALAPLLTLRLKVLQSRF